MLTSSLSVVIITHNEEANIERAVKSVDFAHEVIVVDSHSTDRTVEIAKSLGARVVQHAWEGFGKQKNIAIDHATCDWVLSLDADEIIPTKAVAAIKEAMESRQYDAYYLPRRTFFLGRWIHHGGWYPDWQLRLFRRGITQFSEAEIHERVIEPERATRLPAVVIDHYSYRDVSDYITRLNRYTSLEAEQKWQTVTMNGLQLILKPYYRFFQQYILHRGFMDGKAGFLIAALSAWYVFVVHVKIFEYRFGKKRA